LVIFVCCSLLLGWKQLIRLVIPKPTLRNFSCKNNFNVPNENPSEDFVKQAMVGLLLGDGSLVKKYIGGGTYFKYAQGVIHSSYLYHVFSLFKHIGCLNMENPSLGQSVVKGVTHQWLSFSSKSLKSWNLLHEAWYTDGVKTIPSNIAEILTPVSLAYWLMDDGGWTNTGIHIATNNFTKTEVESLVFVLNTKFGLKCSIHSRNRIYIWTESVDTFVEIVRPYIHNSMLYKITKSN
jgi:hypothetical protein